MMIFSRKTMSVRSSAAGLSNTPISVTLPRVRASRPARRAVAGMPAHSTTRSNPWPPVSSSPRFSASSVAGFTTSSAPHSLAASWRSDVPRTPPRARNRRCAPPLSTSVPLAPRQRPQLDSSAFGHCDGSRDHRGEWFHERSGIVADRLRQLIALVSMEVHPFRQRSSAPRGSQESHSIALRHRPGPAPAAFSASDDRTRRHPVARRSSRAPPRPRPPLRPTFHDR